ncbi:N-acetylmuramoyl-L-alanine amidase [Rossellomorea vietnamensis]|jgi:N-acetylmuramoyl-L-alanine amidase|uniref:N-acetylmuramoyl-L-alanine amidase n=1 Tax=Rossellomorea vietnamensis TaxID=218284 RepID=A0A6I6UNK5_9BACI|nr:N-acetylmuramoyl-L-alanine amidase [Rossellomorea vietnamensis]QHE63498.1 N-acetylmuramoyl-L-alanine amidase [Rossellomorea vietnamensis]
MPIIVLDPGHGGTDPGASANGLQEKNLTLTIGLKVKQLLEAKYVVDVRLTRETDVLVGLSERADYANTLGASYFVSLHHNAGGGTGFESYIYPGTSSSETGRRQDVIHGEIMNFLSGYGVRDRGQKEANFAVLRETAMPAILLENLFIDTVNDANLLKNSNFITGLSNAIATGIGKALKL